MSLGRDTRPERGLGTKSLVLSRALEMAFSRVESTMGGVYGPPTTSSRRRSLWWSIGVNAHPGNETAYSTTSASGGSPSTLGRAAKRGYAPQIDPRLWVTNADIRSARLNSPAGRRQFRRSRVSACVL